jgi:hypothetical protein
MKKITCYAIVFFSLLSFSPRIVAQGFAWAKAIQGQGFSTAIATDTWGNAYTTGRFESTTDFDSGPGVYTVTPSAASEVFICKHDASGNFVWARTFVCSYSPFPGSGGDNQGVSIATDPSGNVYVSGFFCWTLDFDPGPGTYTLATGGDFDYFIAKLDGNGNFVWADRFDIPGTYLFTGAPVIAVDASGNLYGTGLFSGTMDFDPGPGVYNLTPAGNVGTFLVKLSTSGAFVWAQQYSAAWPAGIGKGIDVDAQGNIYTAAGARVSKLSNNGTIIWSRDLFGEEVKADASGNVYLAGLLSGTMDLDPGPGTYTLTSNGNMDVQVVKLDANGNFLWGKGFGGADRDRCLDIALDNTSSVYLTGDFMNTVDFDPGPDTCNSTAFGMDAYIVRLDANGNFGGAAFFVGSTGEDFGTGIDCSANGGVYSTGYFTGTIDFDHTAGTYNMTAPPPSHNIYVHKMDGLVGLAENEVEDISGFYPNPGNGRFRCRILNNNPYQYVVSDPMGKALQTGDLNYSSPEIDLSSLSKGMYFITLQGAKGRYTQKIILQ